MGVVIAGEWAWLRIKFAANHICVLVCCIAGSIEQKVQLISKVECEKWSSNKTMGCEKGKRVTINGIYGVRGNSEPFTCISLLALRGI